jgi:hypothetical protein
VVEGNGIIHVDATSDPTKRFADIDPGTTCKDDLLHCAAPADCDLSVRVAGDEVDLTIVGTYWVHYHCTNPAGVSVTLPREVVVEDKTCPKCAFATGDNATVTVEASFPYEAGDHSPMCEDDCGFSSNTKCKPQSVPGSIKSNNVNVEKTGKYRVVFHAADYHGNSCNDSVVVRTVYVVDTMKPIIGLQFDKDELPTSLHNGGVSKATYVSHRGKGNPAQQFFQTLLATAGTSDAWTLSAAICAIGIALVAVTKNTSRPSFVPV